MDWPYARGTFAVWTFCRIYDRFYDDIHERFHENVLSNYPSARLSIRVHLYPGWRSSPRDTFAFVQMASRADAELATPAETCAEDFRVEDTETHAEMGALKLIPGRDFRISPGRKKTLRNTGNQRIAWRQELGRDGDKFWAAGESFLDIFFEIQKHHIEHLNRQSNGI